MDRGTLTVRSRHAAGTRREEEHEVGSEVIKFKSKRVFRVGAEGSAIGILREQKVMI